MGVEELYISEESSDGLYVSVALHRRRIFLLAWTIIFLLGLLAVRLSYLQIVHHQFYQALSDDNRIRRTYHLARRGIITDHDGVPLVENTPSFLLVLNPTLLPRTMSERNRIREELSAVLHIDSKDLERLSDNSIDKLREVSLGVFLNYDQAIAFELHEAQWPGIVLQVFATRKYRTEPLSLSHIIGYVGTVSTEERANRPHLLPFSLSGKSGLESQYDDRLRGTDGATLWEYDYQGLKQRVVSQTIASDGAPLQTSLSLPIQQKSEEALSNTLHSIGRTNGSVVVMNARTGAIIALVSNPSFDANIFTQPDKSKERKQALTDRTKPLFFRSIAGQYPSGSTIKPLIATIALSEGVITSTSGVQSVGGIRLGEFFFPDWKMGGHGWTTVTKALAESVNTFFYLVVGGDIRTPPAWNRPALGMERLMSGLKKFGWGSPTQIDLMGESSGFLPTPEWKLATTGERWYIGDTYHVAIGQGDLLITPLQLANATAMIASNNQTLTPWIVDQPLTQAIPVASNEVISIVRDGMRHAVTQGSARRLGDLPVIVFAKTGTAQVSGTQAPHSWLTSYATIGGDPIVVTALIENGGEGSGPALTVVKKIYRALTDPTIYHSK